MVKSQLENKLDNVLNKYYYVLTSSPCRLIAKYSQTHMETDCFA